MRFRIRKSNYKNRQEEGHAMSEYVVVSAALVLALIAAINAVNLLLEHHERASAAMQIPL